MAMLAKGDAEPAAARRATRRADEDGRPGEEGPDEEDDRRTRTRTKAEEKDEKDEKPKPVGRSTSTASQGRILPLPIPAGHLSDLTAGQAGQIYYIRRVGTRPGPRRRGLRRDAVAAPLRARRRARRRPSPRRSTASASRPTARSCSTAPRRPGASSTPGKFDVGQGQAADRRDLGPDRAPRRSGRRSSARPGGSTATTSTPPNMHGADWPAMREKYEPFLPARADPRRPQPRDPVDAAASWPSATATSAAAIGCYEPKTDPGRPARGRLRGRQRPLSLQEGLRRPELGPGAQAPR